MVKEGNEKGIPERTQVPRLYKVLEDTDATKSTAQELEEVILLIDFLKRKE